MSLTAANAQRSDRGTLGLSRTHGALTTTSKHSIGSGRCWPARACAISTPSISASYSRRNDAGYHLSQRRYPRSKSAISVIRSPPG